MSTPPAVVRVSECFIKPPPPPQPQSDESTRQANLHLTPFDIAMLSAHYIQKGLLFKKPPQQGDDFTLNLIHNLKKSLSVALSHFYPLAGRLVTQQTQNPNPSYSVFVDCVNGPGARFIHATLHLTVSDILSPLDVPSIVKSLFDHDRAVNHDGHTRPLLSIQLTELIDGVFIACSMNHSIADGTSYWSFFNTLSQIFQCAPISRSPIHNRWFPEGCNPPINLPFKHHDEFVSRFESPNLRERIFHFTADSIAKLKSKANRESNSNKISSFQSVSALVWRCITRARRLPSNQKTSCKLAMDVRSRTEPPLPKEYFGNMIYAVSSATTAGELLEQDLGWAAWKLHVAVASYNHSVGAEFLKEWLRSPLIYNIARFFDRYGVMMGSSPRFDMYGNEFGMGKALAVLSGYANKFDGKVTAYPGRDGGGSVDLEFCLLPDNMRALESDPEFMDSVSISKPLSY